MRETAARLGVSDRSSSLPNKVRLVCAMLHVSPWRHLPLTVHFLSAEYCDFAREKCEPPPEHIPVVLGDMEDLRRAAAFDERLVLAPHHFQPNSLRDDALAAGLPRDGARSGARDGTHARDARLPTRAELGLSAAASLLAMSGNPAKLSPEKLERVLGPKPTDGRRAQLWQVAADDVQGYRERWDVCDPHVALGAEPDDPEQRRHRERVAELLRTVAPQLRQHAVADRSLEGVSTSRDRQERGMGIEL